MALSRFLSQSLTRASLRPPPPLIAHHRYGSSKSHRGGQLIEVDLDAPSDSADAAAEVITVGVKKLEEAIQSIIVRRSAPDWLPFLPGYSYWVPPPQSSLRDTPAGRMIAAMGHLPTPGTKYRFVQRQDPSEDEQMALMSTKGWPSYAFYIEGTWPTNPVVDTEMKIPHDEDVEDDTSTSEDEEG